MSEVLTVKKKLKIQNVSVVDSEHSEFATDGLDFKKIKVSEWLCMTFETTGIQTVGEHDPRITG